MYLGTLSSNTSVPQVSEFGMSSSTAGSVVVSVSSDCSASFGAADDAVLASAAPI